ncbi:MAG: hypothetical protein AB1473_09330 [Thermodesulfobacteriota bacterium]
MRTDEKDIKDRIQERAQRVKDRLALDKDLAERHKLDPGKVVAEEVLNPVVLNKPETSAAEGGCQCSIGACGVGCGPLGHSAYGCVDATPL